MVTALEPLLLRDYQKSNLRAISKSAHRGVKRMGNFLPTGTGKTEIFARLPARLGGRRMLVVAHRTELLDQAAAKIQRANPELKVDIEQANRRASDHADVVVASVQTLNGKYGNRRLFRISDQGFGLIVVDEAHHIIAQTYLNVLSHFGLVPDQSVDRGDAARRARLGGRDPISESMRDLFSRFRPAATSPYLVGFTATPDRTDAAGLDLVLDEVTFSRTLEEMMGAGWLCDIVGQRIITEVDISQVGTSRDGDFNEGQLGKVVNTPYRNSLTVMAYQRYARGRPFICFCVDQNHTKAMTETFQDAGVRCDYVIDSTHPEKRRKIIEAYQLFGELEGLVNCMVLTEGFDAPKTSCIIMARPTQSSLLYTQMLGRGTRLADGKDHLLVLDLADTAKVGVVSINTVFGLPPELNSRGKSVMELKEEVPDYVPPEYLLEAATPEDLARLSRGFNPLLAAALPGHLEHGLAWVKTQYGLALSLPGTQVGIVEDKLGHATVKLGQKGLRVQRLWKEKSLQKAVHWAERYIRNEFQENLYMVNLKGPLHRSGSGPTDKQLWWLRDMELELPHGSSKADAQRLLMWGFARRDGHRFTGGEEEE